MINLNKYYREEMLAWGALGLALALSLWTHALVLDQFIAPTFGNTGIHFAAMRHVIEHQEYPMDDYSYGGGVTNLYVPLYRMGGATLALLTGLSLDAVARLIVLLIAVILPLGTYALTRALFKDRWAGVAAALLAAAVPELLAYTVRPLPQAFGHAMLPLAWYALATRRGKLALSLAFLVSWVHQEAAVYQAGVAFALGALALASWWLEKDPRHRIDWMRYAKLGFAVWALATAAYLGWHHLIAGGPPLWELAQFKYHEGAVLEASAFWDKTGAMLSVLGGLGILALLWRFWRSPAEMDERQGAVLALALVGVGLFTVKNDLVGIRVFMDRFLVYLQQSLLPVAGLAVAHVGRALARLR